MHIPSYTLQLISFMHVITQTLQDHLFAKKCWASDYTQYQMKNNNASNMMTSVNNACVLTPFPLWYKKLSFKF